MKRSSQVALVLMGVTATTAAGAYMMPARSQECRPPDAQRAAPTPNAGLPAAAAQAEPCRRRRSSWGTWNWSSRSSSYDRPSSSSRPSGSVSTALSPSKSTSRPSTGGGTVGFKSTSTSSSSTSRGGFGSTNHGFSSSGS